MEGEDGVGYCTGNVVAKAVILMAFSLEQVQQWIKAWMVVVDPEVEVRVRSPHDDTRENGGLIPVGPGRHVNQMTMGFPEISFPGSPLPEVDLSNTGAGGSTPLLPGSARPSASRIGGSPGPGFTSPLSALRGPPGLGRCFAFIADPVTNGDARDAAAILRGLPPESLADGGQAGRAYPRTGGHLGQHVPGETCGP